MPLFVEDIGRNGEGCRLVSLCHYSEQKGDMMHNPYIVFLVMTCRRLSRRAGVIP
jgi:hypothetical protein